MLNRNGLEDALRRHFGTRPQQPLTLLAIDIDLFKRVNDQHGHAPGDRVLRALTDRLRAAVAATAVPVEGGEVRCTLSIGVSPPCTGADAWDAA